MLEDQARYTLVHIDVSFQTSVPDNLDLFEKYFLRTTP